MEETLWNGIRMLQPERHFRLGTDAVLLADYLTLPRKARVADLGSGSGAIGLLLCGRSADCHVTGIEIQPEACALARDNIARNALEHRFCLLQGDLREIRDLLPASSFDCVVANPPYFPVGSGKLKENSALAVARTEICCTLGDVCAAAGWLVRRGGTFALVHRPERLCDLLYQMRVNRLEPKRIRFVRHTPSAPVSLVLLEGRAGARPGLQFLPDLIQFTPDGAETAEYRAIYHRN